MCLQVSTTFFWKNTQEMVNSIYLPRKGLGGTFTFYIIYLPFCMKIQTICIYDHSVSLFNSKNYHYTA